MKRLSFYLLALMIAGATSTFTACGDKDDISYPYTEDELIHLGNKSGLTSYSSEQAFRNGLNEVLQTYLANNPSSSEYIFDGVTYELTNIQEATGAIPNSIWELFWEKLDGYSYSIGSCWGFVHLQIPSKGKTGTAYALYTIVTQDKMHGGEVLYIAAKGNVSPKSKTRSGDVLHFDNTEQEMELFKSAVKSKK